MRHTTYSATRLDRRREVRDLEQLATDAAGGTSHATWAGCLGGRVWLRLVSPVPPPAPPPAPPHITAHTTRITQVPARSSALGSPAPSSPHPLSALSIVAPAAPPHPHCSALPTNQPPPTSRSLPLARRTRDGSTGRVPRQPGIAAGAAQLAVRACVRASVCVGLQHTRARTRTCISPAPRHTTGRPAPPALPCLAFLARAGARIGARGGARAAAAACSRYAEATSSVGNAGEAADDDDTFQPVHVGARNHAYMAHVPPPLSLRARVRRADPSAVRCAATCAEQCSAAALRLDSTDLGLAPPCARVRRFCFREMCAPQPPCRAAPVGRSGLGPCERRRRPTCLPASASQLVAAAVQVRRAMACARDVRPTRPSHLSRTVRHVSMRRRRRAIYPRARRGAKHHLCSARRSSPSRGKGCAARLDDERTRLRAGPRRGGRSVAADATQAGTAASGHAVVGTGSRGQADAVRFYAAFLPAPLEPAGQRWHVTGKANSSH